MSDVVRQLVREILKEEAFAYSGNAAGSQTGAAGWGMRSMQSMDTDPFSYEDIPGFDVEIYPTTSGKYHVQIGVGFDDKLSSPLMTFANEEEARHQARKYVEKVHRIAMARGVI